MSFLDHLNETMINTDDLFESTEVGTLAEFLAEDVTKFAELPNKWKKLVARKFAGENSEVEIKATGVIKNQSAFNKIFKQGLKDTVENAGVILEVDGEPVIAILETPYRDKKFNIVFDDGNMRKISRSKWDKGTRWSAGSYRQWEDANLGVQEALDAIERILRDAVIAKLNGSIEDEDKKVKTVETSQIFNSLQIAVKVILRDKNRLELNTARNNDRNERNSGTNDSLAKNRREVIKKYTKNNLEKFVADLKNDLPKIDDFEELLLKAAEGESVEFDIATLKTRLDDLNNVLRRFTSAYKTGKIRSTWRNELDWDMKYLKDAVDKLNKK